MFNSASQMVSRFNSLSSQFRRTNSPQQATELAAQLCAILGDVVGQVSQTLSDIDDRLKTADAQIADLECDRAIMSDSDDQLEPLQFPEPEYVELSFDELAIGRAVWFNHINGDKLRVEIREILTPKKFGMSGGWVYILATDADGNLYHFDDSTTLYTQI